MNNDSSRVFWGGVGGHCSDEEMTHLERLKAKGEEGGRR